MKILLVGSGAREHAIALALLKSDSSIELYTIASSRHPALMQLSTQCWVGDITNVAFILEKTSQVNVDLAMIGPEAPLAVGLADALWAANIPTVGPTQALAKIETSKQFARDLMKKHHISGLPRYGVFQERESAENFLKQLGEGAYVIKADGLMGGKGVKVAGDHLASISDALVFCDSIFALNQSVLIEEKWIGQEFSLLAFCDGKTLVPMPLVQDHKRAYNDDKGPNTGGMGTYTMPDHGMPFLSQAEITEAMNINQAVMNALQAETGERYCGIIYGSFIATAEGIRVIEFNARFGDPEALNLLCLLETDFLNICLAMTAGHLRAELVQFKKAATVCKYAVPEGYPDAPLKNIPISIAGVKDKKHLFLGAVDQTNTGLVATGSRTAAYVGVAATLPLAESIAEREISAIEGRLFHRDDIGTTQLVQSRITMMNAVRMRSCA